MRLYIRKFAVGLILTTAALAACGTAYGQESTQGEVANRSTSVLTQAVTPAQKERLISRLKSMDASIVSGDVERMKEAMAPKSYKIALGKALGVPEAQMDIFLNSLDNTLDQTLAISDFSAHNIDYDAIEYLSGKGGVPVAVVPFDMAMTVYGQNFTADGNYYSVFRDGEWLTLSPTDEKIKTLLLVAFPELSTIPVVVGNIQPATGG